MELTMANPNASSRFPWFLSSLMSTRKSKTSASPKISPKSQASIAPVDTHSIETAPSKSLEIAEPEVSNPAPSEPEPSVPTETSQTSEPSEPSEQPASAPSEISEPQSSQPDLSEPVSTVPEPSTSSESEPERTTAEASEPATGESEPVGAAEAAEPARLAEPAETEPLQPEASEAIEAPEPSEASEASEPYEPSETSEISVPEPYQPECPNAVISEISEPSALEASKSQPFEHEPSQPEPSQLELPQPESVQAPERESSVLELSEQQLSQPEQSVSELYVPEPVQEYIQETVEETVQETVQETVEETVQGIVQEPVEESVELVYEPAEEIVQKPVQEPSKLELSVDELAQEPVQETTEPEFSRPELSQPEPLVQEAVQEPAEELSQPEPSLQEISEPEQSQTVPSQPEAFEQAPSIQAPLEKEQSEPEHSQSEPSEQESPAQELSVPELSVQAPEEEPENDKARDRARKEAVEELQNLVGQESVKRRLNEIRTWVRICRQQGRDPKNEWYNIVLQGNRGTGKTTVGRIYAKLLYSMGIADSPVVEEKSGAVLASEGPDALQQVINRMVNSDYPPVETAGVLIIDDSHFLTTELIDLIFNAMERKTGRIIVVLVGSPSEMEGFLGLHPQVGARTCCTLKFADFNSDEMQTLFCRRMTERFNGKVEVEGGLEGPYVYTAARRLARGRGKDGFTNVHAVENFLDTIERRQAQRAVALRETELEKVDSSSFSKEDLLGPSPAGIRAKSEAWMQLQKLVGQESAKASISEVLDTVEENYWRETRNQRPIPVRVNRIFAGPPGTGRTTVAGLFGQILVELGRLSTGEVVTRTLSDLPSGAREIKNLLDSTVDKVLLINVLDSESSEVERKSSRGVLNTLIAGLSQTTHYNRCVILVGSDSTIDTLIRHQGKDLLRVFLQQHVVRFEPFTLGQIQQILEAKLQEQGVHSTPEALEEAMDILAYARMRRDFDNGKAIDYLLASANSSFEQSRSRESPRSQMDRVLVPENFKRDSVGKDILELRGELKSQSVGEDVISMLEQYHYDLQAAWRLGSDPSRRVPPSFVFKGPRGTGRRTVARQLAKLYYSRGVLSSETPVECSVMDLIQTRSQLEKGRGSVLFIEDAHRLAEAEYSRTADELTYLLSHYSRELVVILAGPWQEMDQLLSNRPQLSSLFQEEVVFKNPTPREGLRLLDGRLEEEKIPGPRPFFTDSQCESYREFTRAFQVLSMFPCWNNTRDIDVLTRWMSSAAVREMSLDDGTAQPQLSEEQAMACIIKMFNLKRDRLRYSQDPHAKSIPRHLSQPRRTSTTSRGVKFPV